MTSHAHRKPFWTVQKGQIGTAHINRWGETVNFRPTPFRPLLGSRNGRTVLELFPAKGIEIERLVIECVEARHVLTTEPTRQRLRLTWSGVFEEVQVAWSEEWWEDLQTPEAIAARGLQKEERARREAHERRLETILAGASPEELAALASPTRGELARLETHRAEMTLRRLMERAMAALRMNPEVIVTTSEERPSFLERFRQFAAEERARKKTAFMARAVR